MEIITIRKEIRSGFDDSVASSYDLATGFQSPLLLLLLLPPTALIADTRWMGGLHHPPLITTPLYSSSSFSLACQK